MSERGQTIIEIVLTLSIITIIIIALVQGITFSVKSATYTKNKSLATKYVNEGMEALRSIKDYNWSTFYSYATETGTPDYALQKLDGNWQVMTGISDEPAEGFTRVVNLKKITGNQVEATVTVYWQSSETIPYRTSATTIFTKWQ